jgi:hypothetical protein
MVTSGGGLGMTGLGTQGIPDSKFKIQEDESIGRRAMMGIRASVFIDGALSGV